MAIQKKSQQKDAPSQTEESVFELAHTENEEVSKELNVEMEENKKENKEESIPLSLVQKMMRELEEKFTSKLNSQAQKLKIKRKEEEEEEDDYVSNLEDDWMEQPSVFFSFSLNFSIHGDKRRGVEMLPPQGAIKFSPLIRTKRKGQRGTQVVSVSSVKVRSKEVADYLRNHSLFGIAFYENMDSALNVDSTWAQKMVEAQQSIGRLSDMQVIARAKQEGISVGQSPESMRKQLIEKIAKQQIQRQENLLYGNLKNANIDSTGRQTIEKVIPNM